MNAAGPARVEAFAVLRLVAKGHPINEAMAERGLAAKLSTRDRQLVTQIAYGVLRHRRYLDAWIAPLAHGKLDAEVQDLLRMAFFQMNFLDRVPDYAIVHAAVELTKEIKPKASGLVNAVLRRGLGHPPENLPLAVQYSHPDWLVDRWSKRYGREVETILAEDNQVPPLTLRVNTQKTNTAAVMAALAAQGIEAQCSQYLPEAIRVRGSLWLEDFEPYRRGEISVQDESGMLVAWSMPAPMGPAVVLDMAAGLGGKSTHFLERWPEVTVVAVDKSASRLRGLERNAKRLGLNGRLEAVHDDARHFVETRQGFYQRIILDAPCSGLGVLRRRVDGRWSKHPDDLLGLRTLQRELIESAWQALAPGGILVYSTCSVEPEETQEQIAWTEETQPGVKRMNVAENLPSSALSSAVKDQMLSILPGQFGMDGFFIAQLMKVKA